MRILYWLLVKAARFIGKVNTFILLALFYFVFLGLAKVMAWVSGQDLLDWRWKDRESYWKKRENFEIHPESFLEPYEGR